MKKVTWILAMLVIAAGCSKEEPAAPATEEPAATVQEAVEEVTEAVEEDVAAVEEEVEVVEESAGTDAEPVNEAIVLAQADVSEAPRNWKYEEGRHFTRLVPTQPTIEGPDKIEVTEIFMYSCPGCNAVEGAVQGWEDTLDPNVRFKRIPAVFNNLAAVHAQLYYTEEVLAESGALANRNAFRTMVFNEYHRRNNSLASETAIQRVFARAGVDEATFNRAWNSFEVNQSMRQAGDLVRRYGIASVPAFVVNGKYRVNLSSVASYAEVFEMIDELVAREGVR